MNDRRRRQEDFVQGVLRRTSGSACERALGMLPDLNEERLADLDRQLVQAHLEHCQGCRAVAVTLGWLGRTLPAMAELDPGPAFTAAVVGRTSGALTPAEKAVRRGAAIGPAGLMDRLGRWWQQQIFKPLFPAQFAYVATVILVLLTALPISPFRGAPGQAAQMLQAGPQGLPLVGSAQVLVQQGAGAVLDRAEGAVGGAWRSLEMEVERRNLRSGPSRSRAQTHYQEARAGFKARRWNEGGYRLLQTARAGWESWQAWWSDPGSVTTENSKP